MPGAAMPARPFQHEKRQAGLARWRLVMPADQRTGPGASGLNADVTAALSRRRISARTGRARGVSWPFGCPTPGPSRYRTYDMQPAANGPGSHMMLTARQGVSPASSKVTSAPQSHRPVRTALSGPGMDEFIDGARWWGIDFRRPGASPRPDRGAHLPPDPQNPTSGDGPRIKPGEE